MAANARETAIDFRDAAQALHNVRAPIEDVLHRFL